MYKIKYYYRTGDSFHTQDEESLLEYEWKDLAVVKEALRRIKEHYAWHESVRHPYHDELPKPDWHKVNDEIVGKDMSHYLLNIPMDDGEEVQFWAPWCGYFETLYGAEIVMGGEKFSFTLH